MNDGDDGGCSDDIVDLSRAEFLALQAAAKASGKSIVQFTVEGALVLLAVKDIIDEHEASRHAGRKRAASVQNTRK